MGELVSFATVIALYIQDKNYAILADMLRKAF